GVGDGGDHRRSHHPGAPALLPELVRASPPTASGFASSLHDPHSSLLSPIIALRSEHRREPTVLRNSRIPLLQEASGRVEPWPVRYARTDLHGAVGRCDPVGGRSERILAPRCRHRTDRAPPGQPQLIFHIQQAQGLTGFPAGDGRGSPPHGSFSAFGRGDDGRSQNIYSRPRRASRNPAIRGGGGTSGGTSGSARERG